MPRDNDGNVCFGHRFQLVMSSYVLQEGRQLARNPFLAVRCMAIVGSSDFFGRWGRRDLAFDGHLDVESVGLRSIFPMRVAQNMVLAFGYQRRRILLGRCDVVDTPLRYLMGGIACP